MIVRRRLWRLRLSSLRLEMFGPRWLDAARLGDVKETTLESYRGAAAMFISYLDEEQMSPTCAEEFDDLFVEWTHAHRHNTGQVRYALVAIEFVYPSPPGQTAGVAPASGQFVSLDTTAAFRSVRS